MITSTGNQKVKEIIQLQKKSRARNQAGVFLVEGLRMIQEVPKDRLEKLYVSEGFYQKHRVELEAEGFTERQVWNLFRIMSSRQCPTRKHRREFWGSSAGQNIRLRRLWGRRRRF